MVVATMMAGALAGLAAPFAAPPPRQAPVPACAPVPPPIVALSLDAMYRAGDASFSRVDPAGKAAMDAEAAPVRAFTGGLSRLANAYVASGGRDVRSGGCALEWMEAWARAGAMTRMGNHDAQFLRSVNMAGWAMDFAQVRGLSLPDDPRPLIEAWLGGMAADMVRHYATIANVTAGNNHRYWAGFAAAAVAVDTGDRALLRWGIASARIGIDQIRPDGSLPLEVARGGRALLYHVYAAEPLVMTAEIAAANGIDLYGADGGALNRLVRFATGSVTAPGPLAALAGTAQQPLERPAQFLAWTAFYDRRFPGRLPPPPAAGPQVNAEIGGDMALLAGTRPAGGRP